jgi:transposase
MRELTIAVGRPMVHDLRSMCDAVSYVVKNGVEWRALPVDFPWEAVYAFLERWSGRGLPVELVRRLRELLRQHQGRAARPTACNVDSQTVKAHDTISKKTSGYHGGKKITGRGRHLAVDTEGWLLALVVTAASASDKAGAKILLIRLFDAFSTLRLMWADTGYNGTPLARYAQAAAAITVQVVARTQPALLPGTAPPLGRGAHLRLADALPPPSPRLRAHHRELRGHDLLGHHHHHDQAPGPLRKRPAPDRAVGQRTPPPHRSNCFIYRLLGSPRRSLTCCDLRFQAEAGHRFTKPDKS